MSANVRAQQTSPAPPLAQVLGTRLRAEKQFDLEERVLLEEEAQIAEYAEEDDEGAGAEDLMEEAVASTRSASTVSP